MFEEAAWQPLAASARPGHAELGCVGGAYLEGFDPPGPALDPPERGGFTFDREQAAR